VILEMVMKSRKLKGFTRKQDS